MVMIEQLDREGMLQLAQRTDELGVLSVYVNADPAQDTHLQAAAIDVKNRFRELVRRMGEDDADGGREITAALERIWPQVEELTAPGEPGRGRVAFFALGGNWVMRFESQLPVTSRLVLDAGPFIHPLMEMLDEGRPAGVLTISAAGAEIREWRLGSLEQVEAVDQEYVEAPHERSGQIGGGPQGQYNTPMQEQRRARDRDRTERLVERAVDRAVELVAERGWERIVVSGGERWTEAAVSSFPEHLRHNVLGDSRVLGSLDDSSLEAAMTELLHARHKEDEGRLVQRTLEAGRSGSGALGLSEVVAALNSGRVDHLVYDPEVRYNGSVTADGTLYGGKELPSGEETGAPEPRLTERLVERALAGGARVSPVEGAAQGALKDAEGIGALLRW